MAVYCEHGALSESLRQLQREGFVKLVHFPYDPNSQTRYLAVPDAPSAAQFV